MEDPGGPRKYISDLVGIGTEGRATQGQFNLDPSWHVWDYKHFIFMGLLTLYDAKAFYTYSPLQQSGRGQTESDRTWPLKNCHRDLGQMP